MEFAITSNQILGICALISALWGIYKIVKEAKKPNDDLKKLVNKHEELMVNYDGRLTDIEESNKMILQCLLVIINHDITGNGIDKLKDAREDLQEFLINK